ncbi:hypothetical protein PtB15_7B647 [Puccinia triticina]|nr:hypothetical protein PtB15_7B647 [Puccinia triticina]
MRIAKDKPFPPSSTELMCAHRLTLPHRHQPPRRPSVVLGPFHGGRKGAPGRQVR